MNPRDTATLNRLAWEDARRASYGTADDEAFYVHGFKAGAGADLIVGDGAPAAMIQGFNAGLAHRRRFASDLAVRGRVVTEQSVDAVMRDTARQAESRRTYADALERIEQHMVAADAETEALRKAIGDAALFLDRIAITLDTWARDSRQGGWSTHQVTANQATAEECRKQAAALRRATTEVSS